MAKEGRNMPNEIAVGAPEEDHHNRREADREPDDQPAPGAEKGPRNKGGGIPTAEDCLRASSC